KVLAFFAAKRRKTINIPKPHQLQTWNTDILVQYIRKHWLQNNILPIETLQQKTVALLCLATMARPRSDMGRLQHRDVGFQYGNDQQLESVTLHFREAKETQVKSVTLGVIQDKTICPVNTLQDFIEKTKALRETLPEEHTLFLGYITDTTKVASIRPNTLAEWIKDIMYKAGVATHFKAHSIRSAASTKAVEKGNTIQNVKKHANWSLKPTRLKTSTTDQQPLPLPVHRSPTQFFLRKTLSH
ncbi:hypothetical protein, partial, partial [Parasitella parasitica]